MVKTDCMYQAAYLVCNGLKPYYSWVNGKVIIGFDNLGNARDLLDGYLEGDDRCSASRFAQAHKEIRAKIRDMKNQRKGE